MRITRLGILGSTRGTDLQAIMNAIQQKQLAADIKIVISNKKDAYILERAKQNGSEAVYINPTSLTRDEFDQQISDIMHTHEVDLIVLIGYMRILSAKFVEEWRDKIINVHPSLLPAFAGGMDQDVHQQVLASGVSETGCTVHFVTEEVDAGPILVQKKCKVLAGDTVDNLKERVQLLEGEALIEAIKKLSKMLL
ncbi:MAG: phosphoribosylglycinamide formyltransferase [Gammaproteobacteria bacterium]